MAMILNKNQIFVLDDEDGVRKSLETVLASEGYNVKSFPAGKELINYMGQMSFTAPAVALVDLRLPDMNGVQVMQKIKELSPETEVVMLTGNPNMDSAIESVNLGAYAYILKPYSMDDIKNVLSRVLEKQRLIRENRELTQQLKEWNEKLEEEVYRRTVALQESYTKLQSLYEMRTQFITIMSHELRTPTTAVMGFADTLRDKWKTLPDDKIKQYLSVISEESNRMVLLMSEIFEIAKLQEGKLKLNLDDAPIVPFVGKIIHDFRLRYPGRSFGFTEKDESVNVSMDVLFLKSALSHVLANAVKYTPLGENIIVFTEKQDKNFVIQIEDSGPGLSRDLRDRAFEPFYRSMDDINRKTPGAGLGLTIARGILEGMQGSIRIEDKKSGGSGCAVVITLPIKT